MKILFVILSLLTVACTERKNEQQANTKLILIEDLNLNAEFFDRIRITKDTSLIAGSFDSLTF